MNADNSKLTAYVIMPPKREFGDFFLKVLRPTLSAAGYEVVFSGNPLAQNSLTGALAALERSTFVLIDLTLVTPTVMYLMGVAQGMLKPTILMAQRVEHLPPDFRQFRVIEYSVTDKRIEAFKSKLRVLAGQAKEGRLLPHNPLWERRAELSAKLATEQEATAPTLPVVEPFVPAPELTVSEAGPAALEAELEALLAQPLADDVVEPDAPPEPDAHEFDIVIEPIPTPPALSTNEVRRVVAEPARSNMTIIDLVVDTLTTVDAVRSQLQKIEKLTEESGKALDEQAQILKELRAQGSRGDPIALQTALEWTSEELLRHADEWLTPLPLLRQAWERLMKNLGVLAAVRIETPQDREAARLFLQRLTTLTTIHSRSHDRIYALTAQIGALPPLSKSINAASKQARERIDLSCAEIMRQREVLEGITGEWQTRLARVSSAEPA